MRKIKTVPRGNTRRPDPDGEAWQAEACRRWERAHSRARHAGGDFAAAEFYERRSAARLVRPGPRDPRAAGAVSP